MRKTMRPPLFMLYLLVTAGISDATKKAQLPSPKPEAVIAELDGFYWLATNMTDGTGHGTVRVERIDEVHVFIYSVGDLMYKGVGVRQGSTVNVAWSYERKDVKFVGLSTYKITPGPTLTGRWCSMPGKAKMYDEKLTWAKPLN